MPFFKLDVPFKDKEEAKGLGAKWYPVGRYWYFQGEALPEGLWKWYPSYIEAEGKCGVYIDTETGEMLQSEKSVAESVETISGIEKYKSVSEVNKMIADIVYSTNEFRFIMVKGEVTNFSGKSGRHYYFAIKDEESVLPCVMWDSTAQYALKFVLEKGQQVALCGSLEYYREQGKAQLIVSSIENIGAGQANLELIRLKARLQAEGLFAPESKKIIPRHPKTVGIITSKNGQAIKDICKVAHKRNPYVQLLLFHVNVQGVKAVETIVEGIRILDKMGPDTIIVGRGGGSDEELNVYNDEKVVRAVADASTPIVSAVGHQGHWTLIDYAADMRAATPSEAAEETIPDIMVDVNRVGLLLKGIKDNMNGSLNKYRLSVEARLQAIEKNSPNNRLLEKRERLNHFCEIIDLNIKNIFRTNKENIQKYIDNINNGFKSIFKDYVSRFDVLLAELNGLSPTAKLAGGFGYVTKNGKPVASAKDVNSLDEINIKMHDGDIHATVN